MAVGKDTEGALLPFFFPHFINYISECFGMPLPPRADGVNYSLLGRAAIICIFHLAVLHVAGGREEGRQKRSSLCVSTFRWGRNNNNNNKKDVRELSFRTVSVGRSGSAGRYLAPSQRLFPIKTGDCAKRSENNLKNLGAARLPALWKAQ